MKRKLSTTPIATGDTINTSYPSSVITIVDNSIERIPDPKTQDYSAFQAFYSPKGLTDQIIKFEGDQVKTKFTKMFGSPNTVLYGNMGTWAERFIDSGLRLHAINMAPPDATHANTVVDFRIAPKKTDGSVEMLTIWGWKDTDSNAYLFDKVKQNIIDMGGIEGELKAIEIPKMEFGFENSFIESVGKDWDPDTFLTGESLKATLDKTKSLEEVDVNIPVFGIFYEGRTAYGNNFNVNITDTSIKVNNKYQLLNMEIKDKDVSEYSLDFTLFNVTHDNLSTNLYDNVNKACRVVFTSKNAVQVFRPFLVNRKTANKVKTLVKDAVELIKENFLTAVKTTFPTFDESTSDSNIQMLLEGSNAYANVYATSDTEEGRTLETPFSFVTPWTDVDDSLALLEHTTIPSQLTLAGGSSGKLADILAEEDFSWDIKYDEDDEVGIFEQMYSDIFTGKTDEAIFDAALVRDSIVQGDGLPDSLQKQIAEFCRYRQEMKYATNYRTDFTFFRTTNITSWSRLQSWLDQLSAEEGINYNVKPIVGRGVFNDSTTNGQNKFSLFYGWFGSGSSLVKYLLSSTSDPFASKEWSEVLTVQPNTEEMLPGELEKGLLSSRCINYFVKKSNGNIALGEDTAFINGYDSRFKNTTASIHFNRIINEVSLVARDNPIIDATEENTDAIIRKMKKNVKIPAKFFGNTLEISARVALDQYDHTKKYVAYVVKVSKGKFARYNIVNASINNVSES